MDQIENHLRKHKNVNEWVDEDGKWRTTKLQIITKKQIARIMKDYEGEIPSIKKLRKKYKTSHKRL